MRLYSQTDDDIENETFGRYIIEVCLNERRPGDSSLARHGFIRFWLRCGRLPGTNDEMLYVHANNRCNAMLRAAETRNVLCPACGTPLKGEIGESRLFKMSLEKLAEQVAQFHRDLNGDADIKLIRHTASWADQKTALAEDFDIRDRAAAERRVRKNYEDALYTKGRIEKDTAVSGDLAKKILAFLTA